MFWRTTHDIVMEQVLIRRNDSLCFQAGNVISVQKEKRKKREKLLFELHHFKACSLVRACGEHEEHGDEEHAVLT